MNRSLLQETILLTLSKRPINNLSALAHELECQRPALSRAIHRMEQDKLVQCHERIWNLTDAGRQKIAKKQEVYHTSIYPLLERAAKLAKLYDIPFLTVFECNGWLCIEKHDIHACSELSCAYREMTGEWE